MLLKDMVENPRTGTLVDPDWAEMPDPRPPTDLVDGTALYRPAPDLDQIGTVAQPPVPDQWTGDMAVPLTSNYEMGRAVGVAT